MYIAIQLDVIVIYYYSYGMIARDSSRNVIVINYYSYGMIARDGSRNVIVISYYPYGTIALTLIPMEITLIYGN